MHMEWNGFQEEMLCKWSNTAQVYSTMHNQTWHKYKGYKTMLSWPSIVISAITTSTTFATINTENNSILNIVVGGFMLLSTVLAASDKFFDFQTKSSDHLQASCVYDGIVLEIEAQLSFPRDQREEASAFIDKIRSSMVALKKTCPDIPIHIHNKYMSEVTRLLPRIPQVNKEEEEESNSDGTDSPTSLNKQSFPMPISEEKQLSKSEPQHTRRINPLLTTSVMSKSQPSKVRGISDSRGNAVHVHVNRFKQTHKLQENNMHIHNSPVRQLATTEYDDPTADKILQQINEMQSQV